MLLGVCLRLATVRELLVLHWLLGWRSDRVLHMLKEELDILDADHIEADNTFRIQEDKLLVLH